MNGKKNVSSPHGDSNPRPSDFLQPIILKSLMLYRLSYEGWRSRKLHYFYLFVKFSCTFFSDPRVKYNESFFPKTLIAFLSISSHIITWWEFMCMCLCVCFCVSLAHCVRWCVCMFARFFLWNNVDFFTLYFLIFFFFLSFCFCHYKTKNSSTLKSISFLATSTATLTPIR